MKNTHLIDSEPESLAEGQYETLSEPVESLFSLLQALQIGEKESDVISHYLRQLAMERHASEEVIPALLSDENSESLELIAKPGELLLVEPKAGDLLIRRSTGEGMTHHSVVVGEEGLTESGLISEGIPSESLLPGTYVKVVEYGPVYRTVQDNFTRRLTDATGKMLKGQYLFRLKENTEEDRSRWGAREVIEVKGVELEVFGATVQEISMIINTLNLIPELHIRQIPRIVVGERVGPIGTGRVREGGNSARRDDPSMSRLEITRYALAHKTRTVNGVRVCFTLLHETGHWVDWSLGIYPRHWRSQRRLGRWFDTLNYRGLTHGRGEQSAEAYWRYFTGRLPRAIREILDESPAFRALENEGREGITEFVHSASLAVSPFTAAKQAEMLQPLLNATQNADAITWNTGKHPSDSGISLQELRNQVAQYINFQSVELAIQAHNTANSSAQIAAGTAPMDAVLAEALHQFQKKCFIDTGQHDGKAGSSTLDSLGLINRTGMNRFTIVNNTAKARLQAANTSVTIEGVQVDHSNWFNFIVNPTFFGWQTNRGVHASLAIKLRDAEDSLLQQTAYRGMTPAELGRALGLNELHRGYRPTTTTGMHIYGLAVDIDYTGNPWVSGTPFWDALKRAALLMTGNRFWQTGSRTFANPKQYYHHLANSAANTGAIYDTLRALHQNLKDYLALRTNEARIRTLLSRSPLPSGLINSGETVQQAAARWRGVVQSDYTALDAHDNFVNRDPANGFLNMHKDLVVTLRQRCCLAWGGVDFGPNASGDMMHFDMRTIAPFAPLNANQGGYTTGSYHPCVSSDASSGGDFITDIYELFAGPPAQTGAGADFDWYIHQLAGLESEARQLGLNFRQIITVFRKIYYNSRTAARQYAGAVIGGGAWNILIPGAAGTAIPSNWSSQTYLRTTVDFLRQHQELAIAGKQVDISHAFAGLDAKNHLAALSLAGGIVRMRSNLEATTYIGDLGSVVVNYLYGYRASFNTVARSLNASELNRYFTRWASDKDMHGNADAHAIRLNSSISFADNLIRYYADHTNGVQKRYTLFTRAIGFGSFSNNTFSSLNSSLKTTLKEQIFNSALAYAAATGRRGDVLLVRQNPGPGFRFGAPTFWEAYWNISGWVLDKFIDKMKRGVQRE